MIEAKVLPEYFIDVINGKKTFEIRKDRIDFKVGREVLLREYSDGKYTGRVHKIKIKYVLRNCPQYGLMDGYCIIGF